MQGGESDQTFEEPFGSRTIPLRPDIVLLGIAGVFLISGGVIMARVDDGLATSEFLFQAFMYLALPAGIVLGSLNLNRSDLPQPTWWYIVGGYLGGIAFIAVLLFWSSLSSISAGEPLRSFGDELVFFGNLGGIFGFIAGITRARVAYSQSLQRELERQNDRLDAFAGFLSHDLRNPLTVAKGRLELLENDVQNEHTNAIGNALADIDERTSIDLARLARDTWMDLDTGDAELIVDTDDEVLADRTKLQQVLYNLFRNSIEHCGPGVTVTIGDLEDGFFVQDDGPGIPEHRHDEIFEMGKSDSRSGTGFGLSIVEAIVEAHDWTISVTTGEAGGARFEIRAPRSPGTT